MSGHSIAVRVRRISSPVVLALLIAGFAVAVASPAFAQAAPAPSGRFVLGPLQWTPTIQLREVGVDSNIFNTPTDVRSDATGTFAPSVDSTLTLGIGQLSTQGALEYLYFQKNTNQRALNGRVFSRIQFPLSRIQPSASVAWARVKDRVSDEIDTRAEHVDHAFGAALTTKITQRLGVTGGIDRSYQVYAPGQAFRGADLATLLNKESTNIQVGLRIAATPLTSFFIDGGVGRDGFTVDGSRDTDNRRGNVGFEFAPDAIFSGRAQVGYHQMLPVHGESTPGGAIAFSGVTSSVDMTYTLLGRTRFNPRYFRDSTYSASLTQPYYLSTTESLDILQTLFGPLAVTVRGSRDTLAYPTTVLEPARNDRVDTLGGGLSFRVGVQGTIAIIYDDTKRRSDAGAEFSYTRRRIYTTVTYGF